MPVWVWDGSRTLVFFRRCPDWLLPILNNWIWVCKLDLSRPDGCQFWFGGWLEAFGFLQTNWMLPILNNWIWVCKLDLSRPDGCQFGFGGGSRPFVSLDGALTGCFTIWTLAPKRFQNRLEDSGGPWRPLEAPGGYWRFWGPGPGDPSRPLWRALKASRIFLLEGSGGPAGWRPLLQGPLPCECQQRSLREVSWQA